MAQDKVQDDVVRLGCQGHDEEAAHQQTEGVASSSLLTPGHEVKEGQVQPLF